jgi:nucleoside diphosphate kinase
MRTKRESLYSIYSLHERDGMRVLAAALTALANDSDEFKFSKDKDENKFVQELIRVIVNRRVFKV